MQKDIELALIGKRLVWYDNGLAPDDPRREGSFVIGAVEGVGPNKEVYMLIDEELGLVEVMGSNVVKELIAKGRYETISSDYNKRIYTLED